MYKKYSIHKFLYICIVISIILFSVTACSATGNDTPNLPLLPVSFAVPYEPVTTAYVPYVITKEASTKYTGTSFYITMDIPDRYKYNEDGYYMYKTIDGQRCGLSFECFEVNDDYAFLDKCIYVYSRLNPDTASPQLAELKAGKNTYTYIETPITFDRTDFFVFIDCESIKDVIFIFKLIVEDKDIDSINLKSLIESFAYETSNSQYQRIKINSESSQSATIFVPYQFAPSGLGNIGYSPKDNFECSLNAWISKDYLPLDKTLKVVSGKNSSGIKYEYTLDVYTYDIRMKLSNETLAIKFKLAHADIGAISIEDILNSLEIFQ